MQNGSSKRKQKNPFWILASNFQNFNKKINTVKNLELYDDFNDAEKVAKFIEEKLKTTVGKVENFIFRPHFCQ